MPGTDNEDEGEDEGKGKGEGDEKTPAQTTGDKMALANKLGGGNTTDDYSPIEGGTEEEGSPTPQPQPEATPGLSNFELVGDDNEDEDGLEVVSKPEPEKVESDPEASDPVAYDKEMGEESKEEDKISDTDS